MAGILCPTRFPVMPTAEEIRVKRAIRSGTLGTLVDGVNHLAGWRCLNVITQDFGGTVSSFATDTLMATGESWVRWTAGPVATHLWVGLTCNSADLTTGTEPQISAIVESTAGVASDAGCRWRRNDGTLRPPSWSPEAVLVYAGGGAYTGNVQIVTTPMEIMADAGGSLTTPRLLNKPAAGTDTVLHVTWQNARVYTCSIWEVYREDIG